MAGRTVIADFEGAGLRPIFGTPAARRLALIARRCGFDNVSVVGRDDGLAGVLHDIVPGDAFVKVDGEADSGSAVCEPGADAGERVLVMAAGAVIDAWSVKKTHFCRSRAERRLRGGRQGCPFGLSCHSPLCS